LPPLLLLLLLLGPASVESQPLTLQAHFTWSVAT
jgi:hypothetical protein